jgi:hypothetical protein
MEEIKIEPHFPDKSCRMRFSNSSFVRPLDSSTNIDSVFRILKLIK